MPTDPTARSGALGRGVHVSNPPGYNKVFSIWTGSAVVNVDTVLPVHRALLITNSHVTAVASVTVTNSDGTTSILTIAPSTTITLPIQIKSYNTATSTTMFIYGLLWKEAHQRLTIKSLL